MEEETTLSQLGFPSSQAKKQKAHLGTPTLMRENPEGVVQKKINWS
jgi:hypothetical protein